MKSRWNPFSVIAACGMLLTFGVGDVPALLGTAFGLVLAWQSFSRFRPGVESKKASAA